MEKFNIDSPDWFNIYSDNMLLTRKFDIKEGDFYLCIDDYFSISSREVIQVKKLSNTKIKLIELESYTVFEYNFDSIDFDRCFLKIIAVDGKEIK